ncbi:SRPBCC family protein [Methylocapsa polymorpha]|uniref:SRPBCC family protein n=1 Tax=Methylocapsa polymorpha TaxID=3080828 RepID=A0ABZ0HRR2_9HYPH|nr:SRPBCC family protein [Methylocapsa sp. RX1]
MAGRAAKYIWIGVALIASVLPSALWAHGPSRQKVTEKIEINAPPEKVWAAISDFHDLSWLPGVAKTQGAGGNEPDVAKRQIVLDSGATIDESLYKYDAAEKSYSYRIDNVDVKVLPVNNYSSTIIVLPAEGGNSAVEWRGAFYRGYPNNDPPPELNDEAALKAVTTIYRAGLENLKKKVEAGK